MGVWRNRSPPRAGEVADAKRLTEGAHLSACAAPFEARPPSVTPQASQGPRHLPVPGRILLAIFAFIFALPAAAHETRPAYLELIEQRPSEWAVTWKQPVMDSQALRLVPQLSNQWLARRPASEELTSAFYLRRWQIRAPAGQLAGARLTVTGLDRSITDVLVHARTADGKRFDAILNRDKLNAEIDFGGWEGLAVPAYFELGVHHILAGIDHLLFVLGLVLLVGFSWRLVGVVTSFTVGHSLTLAASTLGYVNAPVRVIEALVALSILFVARELLRGEGDTLSGRKPWAVALIFGLLHGFAFAGALAETGLPQGDIPLALLLFNLGVEAGQLLFVAALGLGLLAARRVRLPESTHRTIIRRLAPYAMGCYAGFLFVERTAAAFA